MGRRSSSLPLLVCSALLASADPVHAQARLSGMVFADAQDALRGYSAPADTQRFQFRRVQLTLDQDLDSVFAVRLQLEADNSELTSNGKAATFLKQVWLRWSHLGAAGDLVMGLSTTPTWALPESYWGYRSLEKTVLDLQGLGFASDLGVALLRAPTPARPLGWHLMLANDNGQKPERDASKKLSLSVPYRFGDCVLEGLGEYEAVPGPRDKWTAKLFGGWQKGADAAGVEVFRHARKSAGTLGADVVPMGASAFGHVKLAEHWRAVVRADWFDPDRELKNAGFREMFWLAAVDATPRSNVHLMPNIEMRSYSDKSPLHARRRADVTLRVTLFYTYK